MRRSAYISTGAGVLFTLLSLTLAIGAANAQTESILLGPFENKSAPPSEQVLFGPTAVPPEFQGSTCGLAALAGNNESVHPGNNIVASSGGNFVTMFDVEGSPGKVTPADGDLTLGADVTLTVQIGSDDVFSGGSMFVGIECPEPDPGTIIVKKVTVPSGDPEQFSYSGNPSGTIGDGEQISETVDAGTYTSTETVPEGWTLTSIVCDDSDSSGDVGSATATFNVAENETVTCTFTNTKDEDPPGTIIVKKVTNPTGDPTKFTYAGNPSGAIGDGEELSETVDAGTYTSTETVPEGWTLTSITCDDTDSTGDVATATATFNVESEETVTCTFTNTKEPPPEDGKIIVIKKTWPVGDPQQFTYSGNPSGTIGDGGQLSETVDPGTYTSTETVPATWFLLSISCDDADSTGNVGSKTATFNVAAGETVTCTFTNEKEGAPPTTKPTTTTTSRIPTGVPTGTGGDGSTRAPIAALAVAALGIAVLGAGAYRAIRREQ